MSAPIRTLVAAVATLDARDAVLGPALELARQTGATLHVVHVFDLPEPIQDAYARQVMLEPAVLGRYGAELRTRLEALVRDQGADERVFCHVVGGSVADRVCRLAAEYDADLLLVGATRRSRIWRRFLGSSAESVVRQATVPVLVLRQSLDRPVRRVLLTTDLSRPSEEAHRRGIALVGTMAGPAAPEFRSVLVIQYEAPVPLPLRRDLLRGVAEREHRAFLKRAAVADTPVAGSIRLGDPAGEILGEAAEWGADLIIVGTHGRAGAHRLLLGSVAGATLRESGCNVLVLPAHRSPQGERRPVQAEAAPPLVNAG